MHYFLFALYNLVAIPLLFVGVRIAVIFNKKIARGLVGRRDLFKEMARQISQWPTGAPRLWFHISSMGEFEQAKPVIQSVKSFRPDARIMITFFSPSGYEHSGQYPLADIISYLPFDSYLQSRKFLRLLRPDVAMVIRHDIWPNFQWHLHRLNIPCYLIDAVISKKRLQRLRYVRWAVRDVFKTFTEIHVISVGNIEAFFELYPYPDRLKVMGDTRYEQVHRRTQEHEKIALLENSGLFQRQKCFIAGSTWPSDEKVILPALFLLLHEQADFKLILTPHELNPVHLQEIESTLQSEQIPFIRLSGFSERSTDSFQVLLIDRMGLLANLYALGACAFVGGGFGPGVHNVLEPAAHGCMVLFGPRHLNSLEAMDLTQRGGGRSIQTTKELEPILYDWLHTPNAIANAGLKAKQLVQDNLGASERIVQRLLPQLPRAQ